MDICEDRSVWSNRYLGAQNRKPVDENKRADVGERYGLTKVL